MSQMKDPSQEYFEMWDGRIGVGTRNDQPSLTQQQFAQDADVNHIMEMYTKTGELPRVRNNVGEYADYSEIKDYRSMLQTVIDAKSAFETLPAKVRYRFQNDPGQLIEFLQDPKNRPEAEELGLVNKKVMPQQNNDELNDEIKVAKSAKTKPKSAPSEEA